MGSIGSYQHGAGDAGLSPNATLNRQGITFSAKPDAAEERQRDFYVTCMDSGRVGWLLGPYPTLAEAEANIHRGSELANKADVWAAFYSFGVASLPKGTPRRVVFA